VLYVQIALVPVTVVPDPLPRGTLVSKSFTAPSGNTVSLELVRGILNPTRAGEILAGATPTLLATDSAIQLQTATGDVVDLSNGEMILLAEPATVRNRGTQPATFVIVRSALAVSATPHPTDQAGLDPALDDAWYRYGCHLKHSHTQSRARTDCPARLHP
jgi:hypothetical protein